MRVTLTAFQLDGVQRVPEAAGVVDAGYIRVTREPGGRIKEWHRTALIFRDKEASEVARQLHQSEIEAWTHDGIVLIGIERTWRRKACSETRHAWLLGFYESTLPAVYPLRFEGVRRDRDEVRASTPMRGRVCVDVAGRVGTRGGVAKRATLTALDGTQLAQLDRVQLQRWDARGLVLAGMESTGNGRRLTEAWQSWFVAFPGPGVEPYPSQRVTRPEFAV